MRKLKALTLKVLAICLAALLLFAVVPNALSLNAVQAQEAATELRLNYAFASPVCLTTGCPICSVPAGEGRVVGVPDPAAVYCTQLGYQYDIREDEEGNQYGVCIFPDGSECDAWDFFEGKCGKEYSYCAKKGYDIETERVNQGSYYTECAVCVSRRGVEEIRIPMLELMEGNGEALLDAESYEMGKEDTGQECVECEASNMEGSGKDLPLTFDWRNVDGHTYIGPIHDQGACGSCYAFAAAASAEGVYNWATGNYDGNCADFSESFIIWCLGRIPPYNDHLFFCVGADYDYYELEALTNEGICNESDFPYTVTDPGSCTHWLDPTTVFLSWDRIPCNDIEAIKTAIMTYGVIDVAVYAGTPFQNYGGGIYTDSNTSCYTTPCYYTPTNHAVALVGWGHDETEGDYWILRNSWGPSWGEAGYMRIAVTSARVACEATYLTWSTTPTPPTVETVGATDITVNSALLEGNLTDLGTALSVDLSFIYGETADCTDGETGVVVETSPSSYNITLDGLSPDTLYYYKAKAVGDGTAYGAAESFQTLGGGVPPTVETYHTVFYITTNSATLVGYLADLGTASSVDLSFIYGETPDCADGEGVFRVKTAPSYYGGTLGGLSPDTLYYYKAKAVGDGTSYGEVRSFTTEPGGNNPPQVSNVTASQGSPIVNITYDVSDAEQSSVSISFDYWDGASWQPCITTTGEGTQSVGTGKSGTWDAEADFDEQYMTDCRIRVTADDGQAENNIGTGESSTFTLDTKDPTGNGCNTPGDGATGVSINPDLTCLTASDDSPPISHYFQLAENDTFSLGLQESSWQSSTTWSPSTLSYSTQYFWRVKAKDNYDNETDYSTARSFTTLSGGGVPPTVETYHKVFNITDSSVTLVGNLTDLGTASSIDLSFVYGETTACTDGEGVFRVKTAPSYYGGTLGGLSPNTLYYYKAKAVGDGTAYGEVRSFITAGFSSVIPEDLAGVFSSTSWQLSGSPFPAYDNINLLLRFYLAFL